MGNKNKDLELSYVNRDIGHIGQWQKPSMVAHTVPVARVKQRRSPSPGVQKRDFSKERSAADDLDFDLLDWFLIEVRTGKEDVARMVCRAKGFGTCLPMRRTKARQDR